MGKTIFIANGKNFYSESSLVSHLKNNVLQGSIIKFKNARKTDVTSSILEKHRYTISKRKYHGWY